MLHISNPKMTVADTLSRLTHDHDLETVSNVCFCAIASDSAKAMNATYALGLISAGTNNARVAQMLRQLAVYYSKEPNALFMVRIAQGMVQMVCSEGCWIVFRDCETSYRVKV